MKNSYLEKFSYNFEANNQFIEIFNREKNLPNQSLSIFSHILNAHLVWLNRMNPLKDTPIPGIWELQAISDFSLLNQTCFEKTESFLEDGRFQTGEENIIVYQNSKGTDYENSAEEIFFHILMHSMYHRGQIAKQFRKADIEPPATDFIFKMRNIRLKN